MALNQFGDDTFLLIHFDVGSFYDLRPFGRLGLDESAKLGRTHRVHLCTLGQEQLLYLLQSNDRIELFVQSVDDGLRRTSRGEDPHHMLASYPGTPASEIVGTSGSIAVRFDAPTPSTLSLPDLI